jgi:hypothetical protein
MSKIDSTRLKELLHYDPSSGVFTWIVPKRGTKISKIAGCIFDGGYRKIKIDGKDYKAHRLAWLYVYGNWPIGQIDHKNLVKDDNRICNLRDVTASQNQQNQLLAMANNKLGVKGVSKKRNKFRAAIGVGKKKIHIGTFDTIEDAKKAYEIEAAKLHTHNPSGLQLSIAN